MKTWFRSKFNKGRGRSPQSASPRRATSPEDPPRPAAVYEPPSPSLQERLWNQAYDALKTDEPKVVEAYERFLSTELQNDGGGPLAANDRGQHTERRQQMEQLTQIGLRRTEKAAAATQKIVDGLQTVNIVKGLASSAVQTAPAAAVAWVGVCFALEILSTSFTEAHANRTGLAYVVSRMDWYWNLVGLLLDGDASTEVHELRGQLEDHILQLYRKLLLYQMRSVCVYHQNPGVVFLKDMVKLDDWRGQLDEIKDLEAVIARDSEQYNSQRAQTHLRGLAATADRQCTEFQRIASAVQDQTIQQEQMYRDEKDEKCLQDLYETDPIHDKTRIQNSKGGLLRDSYAWVLNSPDFQQWRSDSRGLFWIRGDPGKGKTMLICGIIDELKKDPTHPLAYFFCQATEQRLNTATAVLRGLIYTLVRQHPPLISHVRKEYDGGGKRRFEGPNAWEVMSNILTAMLSDPILDAAVLVVDALDECGAGRPELLDFVIRVSGSSRAKWIVSSRNWPDIEERLATTAEVTLRLELNEDSVSEAVRIYIRHKVGELAQLKSYDDATRDNVYQHFTNNANNTFLWVALVSQELASPKVKRWHTARALENFPPGLDSLYQRMMEHIRASSDADLCRQILAVASVAYRPLALPELICLIDSLAPFHDDPESLQDIVASCGSFLTLRDNILYFVHQSAKDFLLNKASDNIFPHGITNQHHIVSSRSLEVLSRILRRDIYDLKAPGVSIDDVSPPNPDPLAPVRYLCVYWVDHVRDAGERALEHLQDGGVVRIFLQRKYLYWLEAMSLQRSIFQAVEAVQELQRLAAAAGAQRLVDLVQDAHRFVLYYKGVIEIAPLQLYVSALIFSPIQSQVRSFFKHNKPGWVTLLSEPQPEWNACVQTLEGHGGEVNAVAFTADGKRLASGSDDTTVKVWNADTGQCVHTLEGHGDSIGSVAFTADDKWLASGSSSGIIEIWDMATVGRCVQTLTGHGGNIRSLAFTTDGTRLASGSRDKTIKVWDMATGRCIHTLRGHGRTVLSVVFMDSTRLASGCGFNVFKVWDIARGTCVQTHELGESTSSVSFTVDGTRFATRFSLADKINIWDTATGQHVRTIDFDNEVHFTSAFTTDGTRLATGYVNHIVKVWDTARGQCLQILQGHCSAVKCVAFTTDGARLASGSNDGTIKIWDAVTNLRVQTSQDHDAEVPSVTFAANATQLASASFDTTVKVWDVATGRCVQTLEDHDRWVWSIAFSADGTQLASGSADYTIKVWDVATGRCVQTLRSDHSVGSVAFTTDSAWLASGSEAGTIKVWDVATGKCLQTLRGHTGSVLSIAFVADSSQLASGSSDKTVKIWNVATGTCLQSLTGHSDWVSSVAFTADGIWVASGSRDKTVKIWHAATGTCIRTLAVSASIYSLSFDSRTNSSLLTEHGTLALEPLALGAKQQEISPTPVHFHGFGVSSDGIWIVKDTRRLLWLPSEYRPWQTAVAGPFLALGCISGRVAIFQFAPQGLEL